MCAPAPPLNDDGFSSLATGAVASHVGRKCKCATGARAPDQWGRHYTAGSAAGFDALKTQMLARWQTIPRYACLHVCVGEIAVESARPSSTVSATSGLSCCSKVALNKRTSSAAPAPPAASASAPPDFFMASMAAAVCKELWGGAWGGAWGGVWGGVWGMVGSVGSVG